MDVNHAPFLEVLNLGVVNALAVCATNKTPAAVLFLERETRRIVGALVGGTFLLSRGHNRSTPIPFGPFIAVAGWVWFMGGEHLFAAYRQVLGLA